MAASEKVKVFNDVNFDDEVVKSDLPVLVDFAAEWCGPCKVLAPIVAQIATEFEGRVKVGTVDVEESPVTAGKYGVASLPTIMVFKGGTVSAKQVGRTTKAKLTELLEL
jgi:thioredoxin 1